LMDVWVDSWWKCGRLIDLLLNVFDHLQVVVFLCFVV
jgi:hypothetical protein